MNKSLLTGLIVTGLLFLRCSMNPVAGGSSQQGNGTVIGHVVYQGTGLPAKQAKVRLRRADFINYVTTIINPVSFTLGYKRDGYTDENGAFVFAGIDTGRYCIEVIDDTSENAVQSNAAFLRCRITPADSSVMFTTVTLKPTGRIEGEFASIPRMADTTSLQLYGLGRKAVIDTAAGKFVIHNVPEGSYLLCVVTKQTSFTPQGADSVSVVSERITNTGSIDMLPLNTWQHSRQLFLNTTATGADVSGTVTDFPVLIRLGSATLNFAEADENGDDIRFTKSDGVTPLACEIELWDAPAALAAVWVRVDTVYGDNQTQSITMLWGNPDAHSASNSAAIFDTAAGFRGVWHLGEEVAGTGTGALYGDATGINNGDDYLSDTDREGIVGYGHRFDGVDDYIRVNGEVAGLSKASFTLSLWVKISGDAGTVFSKQNADTIWQKGEFSLYFGDGRPWVFDINGTRPSFVGFDNDYAISSADVPLNDWHHLVFSWKWNGDSTGTARYFIDGNEILLSTDTYMSRQNDLTDATLWIGKPNFNESNAYFKGSMDEFEISGITRSADWIKLGYMSQKQPSALVVFK